MHYGVVVVRSSFHCPFWALELAIMVDGYKSHSRLWFHYTNESLNLRTEQLEGLVQIKLFFSDVIINMNFVH